MKRRLALASIATTAFVATIAQPRPEGIVRHVGARLRPEALRAALFRRSHS